jgi:hypothetical protein
LYAIKAIEEVRIHALRTSRDIQNKEIADSPVSIRYTGPVERLLRSCRIVEVCRQDSWIQVLLVLERCFACIGKFCKILQRWKYCQYCRQGLDGYRKALLHLPQICFRSLSQLRFYWLQGTLQHPLSKRPSSEALSATKDSLSLSVSLLIWVS